MRTPGRCTNNEGCWISASHRDVWLNVGEDFTCPNCGSMLCAPPGRAVHMRGMKKAAFATAATAMGVAAAAVLTVKYASVSLSPQPALTAMLHAPSNMLASMFHRPPMLLAALQPPTAPDRLQATAPAAPPALAKAAAGTPQAPGPVTLFTAATPVPVQSAPIQSAPAALAPKIAAPVMTAAKTPATTAPPTQTAAVEAPPPASFTTLVSEAALVVTPMTKQRPVILPISFGKPQGPETDDKLSNRAWRYHRIGHRRNIVEPAPVGVDPNDAISGIRTSADLR